MVPARRLDESDRPLKVTVLNEFFYPDDQGGTGTAMSDVTRRLRDAHGVRITTVTSRFAYRDASVTYPSKDQWGSISIRRVYSPNWSRDRTAKRFLGNAIFTFSSLVGLFCGPKPDVVLVSTAPLTLPVAARLYKALTGVPYAYLIYDLDPDRAEVLGVASPTGRAARTLRKWQTKWLRGAQEVVVIGRCMKSYIHTKYGIENDRLPVVEVGADPDVVRPGPSATNFREKHGISGFVVLYSGNFGQYHDFDTILDAAERLLADGQQVTFVLVGGGNKKAAVEAAVEQRKLTNIRIFPFVPESEFSDLLASSNLSIVTLEPGMEGLCVPSKFYSFLASGRATLALMDRKSEVALVVEEAKCGYHVEIGDVDGLVKMLVIASQNPEELAAQGARGRDVFDRLYSADRVADKLYDVLVRCARRNAKPVETTSSR